MTHLLAYYICLVVEIILWGAVAEISLLAVRMRVVTIPVHVNIHLRLWTRAFEEFRLSHDGKPAAKSISNVRMRDEAVSLSFFNRKEVSVVKKREGLFSL